MGTKSGKKEDCNPQGNLSKQHLRFDLVVRMSSNQNKNSQGIIKRG